VCEISLELLYGFVPYSQGRHVWYLVRTSLKVKGQGHQGQKQHFSAQSAACVWFMFGKTSLASSFFSLPKYVLKWLVLLSRLAHVSQFIIGSAGPVVFTAGPTISALWFPPEQRTTATAIATIAGFAGSAGCFIFGMYIVVCVMYVYLRDIDLVMR